MRGKLRMWIISNTLLTGPREVLDRVLITKSEIEEADDEIEVAEKWKPSEVIDDDARPSDGVKISEDRRLILGTRRAVVEEEKYMFKLAVSGECQRSGVYKTLGADQLAKDLTTAGYQKFTFMSPSLRHIVTIGPGLKDRGIDMCPTLFGDHAWNTVTVNWAEPGSWKM